MSEEETKEPKKKIGRPKGSPNKMSSDVLKALMDAVNAEHESLQGFWQSIIREFPETAAKIIGRRIPQSTEVTGEGGGPIVVQLKEM